jgi:hypothetical protein
MGDVSTEDASASAMVPALETRSAIGEGNAPVRRGRRRPLRDRARTPRSARGLACDPSEQFDTAKSVIDSRACSSL